MSVSTSPLTLPTDAKIRRHLEGLYRRKVALERLIRSLEAYRRTVESRDARKGRAA